MIHERGLQMRTFPWVGDVVAASIRAASGPIAIGKTYNVGSGTPVTIKDLAELMLRRVAPDGQIRHGEPLPGDIREFNVDSALICMELGMTFEQDFERGPGATLD